MNTIMFHGPSGSGKDTQVEKLMEKISLERIATGEMLRKMFEEGDPDAITAKEDWNKGKWSQDEQVYRLLAKWLKRFNREKLWVFVSAVRRPTQIPLLDNVLSKYDRKINLFIHFTLSEEIAIERISLRKICPNCQGTFHPKFKPEKIEGICDYCGTKLVQREDDTPEKVKARLEEYNKYTGPILEEYRNRGILEEIDASQTIEEIHKQVLDTLKKYEIC